MNYPHALRDFELRPFGPHIKGISSVGYIYAVSKDGTPIVMGRSDNFDDQVFRVLNQELRFKKVELERSTVGNDDSWVLNLECH